ncbi:MAG: hypothetical protein II059_06865 [Clostridia bacterium]|nr:hypothetical protein [Clostridia bacterium]
MSYYNKTVSVYGTELQFVQKLIEEITSADSRITCLTDDIEEQFADDSATPTFSFSFAGWDTITFTRNGSGTTNNYIVRSTTNTSAYSSISFISSSTARTSTTTRTYSFRIAGNSQAISFEFTGYNSTIQTPNLQLVVINNGSISGTAIASSNEYGIRKLLVMSDNSSAQKVDRLPYTYNSQDTSLLEYSESKTFLSGSSTNRVFSLSKMRDVTATVPRTTISLDGQRYYVLDQYTIMEV